MALLIRPLGRAGTAVGFATAFQAPIGGLMFAIEELATNNFSQALGWQIFFACMLAVLMMSCILFLAIVSLSMRSDVLALETIDV